LIPKKLKMKKDLLNIFSRNVDTIDTQKLTDYLTGKLSDKERDDLEKQLVGNDFENEAIEGLQNIKNKNSIPGSVEQINALLVKQLQKKKKRKEKRRLKEYPWVYLTIIILLTLCVLGYLITRKFLLLHHS
jgi:hypothetical protein